MRTISLYITTKVKIISFRYIIILKVYNRERNINDDVQVKMINHVVEREQGVTNEIRKIQ